MTTPITAAELDAMEARAAAATPGPWGIEDEYDEEEWDDGDDHIIRRFPYLALRLENGQEHGAGSHEGGRIHRTKDADFIAASRTDLPRLVAEVRRLRAANKLLWEVLSLRTDVLVRLIEFAESEAKVDSRFGVWDDARASIASTFSQLQEAMRLDTPPVACHNPPPARRAVEGSNGEKDQPVGGSEDA